MRPGIWVVHGYPGTFNATAIHKKGGRSVAQEDAPSNVEAATCCSELVSLGP